MFTIPKPLIDDISEGRCLPFIGAGFSKNAESDEHLRMPDWSELGKLLAQEMKLEKKRHLRK
jgi:hypothetical protein